MMNRHACEGVGHETEPSAPPMSFEAIISGGAPSTAAERPTNEPRGNHRESALMGRIGRWQESQICETIPMGPIIGLVVKLLFGVVLAIAISGLGLALLTSTSSGPIARRIESSYGVSDVRASDSKSLGDALLRTDIGDSPAVPVTFRTKAGKVAKGMVASPDGGINGVRLYVTNRDGKNIEYNGGNGVVANATKSGDKDGHDH